MRRIAVLMVLLLAAAGASAQALFAEGQHYVPLKQAQPTTGDGVEVLEFFSYGCPHCFHFEEDLEPWVSALPDDVRFERVPAGLGRAMFQQMAAAYHIANQTGNLAVMHPVLFDEIHVKRSREVFSLDGLVAVFAAHTDLDKDGFIAALNSEPVRTEFARTEGMMARYDLTGVPMLVVAGKYKISRNEHVDSYAKMLQVADFLIQQERAAAP